MQDNNIEGIKQEIKSKVINSNAMKRIKEEIKKDKSERLLSAMMAKAKDVMTQTLIENVQEYFPLNFSHRTLGSIYKAVIVIRIGMGFEVKILPSLIILDGFKRRKIETFWNESIGENTFFEEEDDEFGEDAFAEEEDVVTEDFTPYNNLERQGNNMSIEQLCQFTHNQVMKKLETIFAGMTEI